MGGIVRRVRRLFGKVPADRREEELRSDLAAAQKEWRAARAYFDAVSEPELVEYAIYQLVAAERKYMYLHKRLRKLKDQAPLPPGRARGRSEPGNSW